MCCVCGKDGGYYYNYQRICRSVDIGFLNNRSYFKNVLDTAAHGRCTERVIEMHNKMRTKLWDQISD